MCTFPGALSRGGDVPSRAPSPAPARAPCRGAPMTGDDCCGDETYSYSISNNTLVNIYSKHVSYIFS